MKVTSNPQFFFYLKKKMPLRILISHFLEQLLILFFFSLAYFNASPTGKDNKNKAKNMF